MVKLAVKTVKHKLKDLKTTLQHLAANSSRRGKANQNARFCRKLKVTSNSK